jgi:hypothetical protein
MTGTRASAIAQAKAGDLVDVLDRPIPIALRAASVARLGSEPAHVFFEDPADNTPPGRRWQLDPDSLLVHYYQSARDLVDLYGRRLRPVSGAASYEWLSGGLVHADLQDFYQTTSE